jgi:tryptophanyl-tRNA synthetase
MSKSEPSEMSRINLKDDSDTIAKKIRKAKTDPDALPSEPAGLEGRPEAENLVGIYAALAEETIEQSLAQHGGAQFSEFKRALADLTVAKISPIGDEMRRLMAEPAEIDAILRDGADRARVIADENMKVIKEIVGFIR